LESTSLLPTNISQANLPFSAEIIEQFFICVCSCLNRNF
jgi:hypothetical protein